MQEICSNSPHLTTLIEILFDLQRCITSLFVVHRYCEMKPISQRGVYLVRAALNIGGGFSLGFTVP